MIFDDRNAQLRYNCIPLARNDVQASTRPSFPPPRERIIKGKRVGCARLANTLVIFDEFNIYFQTSKAATIHKLHTESERLLKTVLSFFVKSSVIRLNSSNLIDIEYSNPSNQVSDEELFIGDETTAFPS